MRKIACSIILIFLCTFSKAQLAILKPGAKPFYITDTYDGKSKKLLSAHSYFIIEESTGTKRLIRTFPPENLSASVDASRIAEFDKLPVLEKKKHFIYVFDTYRKLFPPFSKKGHDFHPVYEHLRDEYVKYWIATKDPALQNKYFFVTSEVSEVAASGEDNIGYARMFVSAPDEFIRQLKKQPKAVKSSIAKGMEYGLMGLVPNEATRKVYLEKLKKQL